jgi:hypothetical protein
VGAGCLTELQFIGASPNRDSREFGARGVILRKKVIVSRVL